MNTVVEFLSGHLTQSWFRRRTIGFIRRFVTMFAVHGRLKKAKGAESGIAAIEACPAINDEVGVIPELNLIQLRDHLEFSPLISIYMSCIFPFGEPVYHPISTPLSRVLNRAPSQQEIE